MSLSDFQAFQHLADAKWTDLPGFPGIQMIELADNFDEAAKTGRRTRLVRFLPGAKSEKPLIHSYWEEAYLIEGEMLYEGAPVLNGPAYRCRPPGTSHGPYSSPRGCMLLESHYFAPSP
ncbi:cupin domain-containing protein [Ramlibacter sp.]|uniref:cupin domain-containing protein n=1 Tax=Ramlibacter sp. TaxID=1917967 RepID=UPI003D100487